MNKEVMLKNVRLAFSDGLVKAKALSGGKPRFGCNLIIEDDKNLALVNAAVKEIVDSEFAGKTPPGKDCALRDGNDNIDSKTDKPYKGFAGNSYLSANRAESKGPPLVLDRRKNDITDKPLHEEFPYAGDYVNARVQLYSLNGKNDRDNPLTKTFGKKVCCSIEVIQLLKKGEPFAGGGKPTAAGFEELPDDEDDV